MATIPDPSFDIREQIARIDKMRAETEKNQVELQKIIADTLKVRQDTKLAPYTIVFGGLGAGAALFAAGGAFVKLLFG